VLDKIKKNDGAIIMEASISLTAFMFFIVTVLTLINICSIQAKMSYAINATAKELSQYSYLYSLTGLNSSQYKIHEQGNANIDETKQDVTDIMNTLSSAYGSMEKLGSLGADTISEAKTDVEAVKGNIFEIEGINLDTYRQNWDDAVGTAENIKNNASELYTQFQSLIGNDPKKLMFGVVQLAASEGFDLVKSRLVAAPLAKVMIQKHLCDYEGQSVEEFLGFLRVVPKNGSRLNGLDFNESLLFPNGSGEIRISVAYDVKIIPLLPIDFSFHFNQTAVTHGWLAGDVSFKKATEYVDNDTLWTASSTAEREELIRHLVIDEQLASSGTMEKATGLTDVQLYDSGENQFISIYGLNPIYVQDGHQPQDISQLTDNTLKEKIEQMCANQKSTTDGMTSIKTKKKNTTGGWNKQTHDCTGASDKIILVVPEDDGVKDRIESIVQQANTRGVQVEVVASFGKATPREEVQSSGGE